MHGDFARRFLRCLRIRTLTQECHIDLRKMARFAGVVLVHTEAVGLDTGRRLIRCKDGRPPIPYDVLSIDIGSTPKFVEARVRRQQITVDYLSIPMLCLLGSESSDGETR